MTPFDQLHVNPAQEATLAQQLRQQLTWLIVNGQIKPGDQLPTVHQMAERLGINLHTVRSAYQKLESDGLVKTRQGRGTHVLPLDLYSFAQTAGAARSHTVGVILPSWENPFYHAFLQGVEAVAQDDQTMIFLCNTHDDPLTAWREFARLATKQVDGILVVSHDISEVLHPEGRPLERMDGLPLVTVDWPGSPGYSVQLDLEAAGWQAAHHLVDHGHRQVGLITFVLETANTRPVEEGYQRALREAGLPLDPALVQRVPGFDMDAGAEGMHRLMALPNPPTAVFAIADTLALGALQAARQAGLRVPSDVALAGFNDIPTAALVDPPLTTVAAPGVEMGRAAMQMLRTLIAGQTPPRREVVLPTRLIVRQSCGEHRE